MGIIVLRQAGTLHALMPLVSKMRLRLPEPLQVLGWNQLLSKDVAEANRVQLFSDLSEFQKIANENSTFLLTGTSEKSTEDAHLWHWAKKLQIPSFAFVDQWSNIAIRFKDIKIAPDHILVIDDWAANEVANLGLSSKVHVVGTPLWDELSKIKVVKREDSKSFEAVFVTEPVSAIPLTEHIRIQGYQDLDSLSYTVKAIELWETHSGKRCRLKVKLHPRDSAERIHKWMQTNARHVQYEFSDESKEQIFQKADFIFGDRSMFMVEASMLGLAVVSFQPNRKTESPATDRKGIEVVTQENEILNAMLRAQKNKPNIPAKDSSEYIIDLVERETK